jgi:hypothetical protein
MRTSSRLTVLANALRPLIVAARQLEEAVPPGGVTRAKVEAIALSVTVAVHDLDNEAAILRAYGD